MLALAAAVLLSSTVEVAKGLRNLAQMHQVVGFIELRRGLGRDVPADLPPDPWGTPYRIEGDRVVSAGSDRVFEESPAAGQFEGTDGDVVFANGALVRSNRNWLYARVRPATDAAGALDELRRAEMSFMYSRTPMLRDLLAARATAAAMQRGDTKVDVWGTPLRFEGTRVISAGADRQFDPMSWSRAATNDVGEDIIVENGAVTRAVDPRKLLEENAPSVEPIPQPVDGKLVDPGPHRRIDKDIIAPVVVNRVEPLYAEEYRRARITGIVIVEAAISDKGVVENVRLVKICAPDLDTAAMDAVRQWTFEPAKMDGKPVAVIFNLTVNFKLK
ncbi:MAG: energy transducer TonB [Thermoanaerobaculia bacterium]